MNKRRTYTGLLTKNNMPLNGIFVFGSNTEGRHGKGNALIAAEIDRLQYVER